MDEPNQSELAVDQFVDLAMRGQAPSVAEFAAAHPELAAADIARLEKLARVLGREKPSQGVSELPFASLGAYTLISKLGAGGMGVVYLAEDARLGRRVALKIMRPELAHSRETAARFEREARSIAKLRHENIVTVFEAGSADGVPFIAMEFVHGASLDEIFARARLEHRHPPVLDLLRWIRDVARALEVAHASGLVHRDVKPSNVRVTPEGRALLLDFGLALDPESASLSRTGQVHGTLFYVSPEQVSGGKVKVDARGDVWSLGVTLYEGLTGRVPFEGDHQEEILYRILTAEPVAPRELAPDLARDVETVVLKALEKDRDRRYASAAAFAADLTAILEHRTIEARPTGTVTKVWKWSRRKPAHATAVVLASLLLIGGPAVFAFVQARHANALAVEKSEAIAQRELAESRARDLEESAKFQGEMLQQVKPQALGAHWLAELREEARAAWSAAGASGSELDAQSAEFDRLIADANVTNVAVTSLQRDVLEPAIAAAQVRFADRPKVCGMMLHGMGSTCWSLGLAELALSTQQAAFDTLRAHTPKDDRDTLAVEANLGFYLLSAGRASEGEPFMREAAEGLTRVVGAEDEGAMAARHNFGLLLRKLERYSESERVIREVLTTRRRVLGDDDPATLATLGNLGALLLLMERREEAEPIVRESYVRRRRVLGPGDESTLSTANNLGVLYKDLGRLADSELVFQEAYDSARRSLGDRHPLTSFLLSGLGELLAQNGCLADASEAFRRGYETSRVVVGPHHSDTMYALAKLASSLRQQNRRAEADALLSEAYAEICATVGETHADVRNVVYQYAILLREEGRFGEASDLFAHLADAARTAVGPLHDRTRRYTIEYLATLRLARRFAEAASALDAAVAAMPADIPMPADIAQAAVLLYTDWNRIEPSDARAQVLEQWRARAH